MINDAKVWLDSGNMFGIIGYGYQRINIACPRKILNDAIDKIYNAFKGV